MKTEPKRLIAVDAPPGDPAIREEVRSFLECLGQFDWLYTDKGVPARLVNMIGQRQSFHEMETDGEAHAQVVRADMETLFFTPMLGEIIQGRDDLFDRFEILAVRMLHESAIPGSRTVMRILIGWLIDFTDQAVRTAVTESDRPPLIQFRFTRLPELYDFFREEHVGPILGMREGTSPESVFRLTGKFLCHDRMVLARLSETGRQERPLAFGTLLFRCALLEEAFLFLAAGQLARAAMEQAIPGWDRLDFQCAATKWLKLPHVRQTFDLVIGWAVDRLKNPGGQDIGMMNQIEELLERTVAIWAEGFSGSPFVEVPGTDRAEPV